MHFFSPAERMPLLEVIRPVGAADWAVESAVALGIKMGKTVIVVGDAPGFYTSRVLGVMMNEAAILLGEGARIEDVDRAMTAFGFPVGPFVLFDEVGLEVARHAGETVTRAFGDRIPAGQRRLTAGRGRPDGPTGGRRVLPVVQAVARGGTAQAPRPRWRIRRCTACRARRSSVTSATR